MTKKVKSLNQDQLYELMWSNDWKIVEQTQKLLDLCESLHNTVRVFCDEKPYKQNKELLDEIQALIDKKYNIIGAQMILDEVEE